MIHDLELMNIHVRALYTHATKTRLMFVNEPDNKTISAARLFLGRTREGNVWRFRSELPDGLCEQLNELCVNEPPLSEDFRSPPLHLESYLSLLEPHAPGSTASNGLAYQFTQIEVPSMPVVYVTEETSEVLRDGFEKLKE